MTSGRAVACAMFGLPKYAHATVGDRRFGYSDSYLNDSWILVR
jgi:hypothetical protein